MKVGFFQFDVAYADKQRNLNVVKEALERQSFDLVLLPELFATGSIFCPGRT